MKYSLEIYDSKHKCWKPIFGSDYRDTLVSFFDTLVVDFPDEVFRIIKVMYYV